MFKDELSDLDNRFDKNYDLLYVDPLICDPALNLPRLAEYAFWQHDEKNVVHFLRRFLKGLDVGSTTVASYERDLAKKIQADRELQKKVAHIVDEERHPLNGHYYCDVDSLLVSKRQHSRPHDESRLNSLVVVDGAFFHSPGDNGQGSQHISPPMQEMIHAAPKRQGNSMRTARGALVDRMIPLLTLPSSLVGLIVSERTFYRWNETFTAVLSAGWYPLSRVVGFYIDGGIPLIEVLAILLRPYPSLCELGSEGSYSYPEAFRLATKALTRAAYRSASATDPGVEGSRRDSLSFGRAIPRASLCAPASLQSEPDRW